MSDKVKAFITCIDQGEKDKVYVLWQEFMPLIKKWSYSTPLDGYTIDDLMQQSFILFQKALADYDRSLQVPFEGFYRMRLYSWRGLAFRKKVALPMQSEESFEQLSNGIDPEQDTEKLVLKKETYDLLYEILKELGEKERYILLAYYFYRKQMKDIAKELGYSYRGLECKKSRILMKLRLKYATRL